MFGKINYSRCLFAARFSYLDRALKTYIHTPPAQVDRILGTKHMDWLIEKITFFSWEKIGALCKCKRNAKEIGGVLEDYVLKIMRG